MNRYERRHVFRIAPCRIAVAHHHYAKPPHHCVAGGGLTTNVGERSHDDDRIDLERDESLGEIAGPGQEGAEAGFFHLQIPRLGFQLGPKPMPLAAAGEGV